jgi:hypothetical protein
MLCSWGFIVTFFIALCIGAWLEGIVYWDFVFVLGKVKKAHKECCEVVWTLSRRERNTTHYRV